TRQSLLSIFDTLYSIYFNQNYEKNIQYKTTNYQKMNTELE
ncbi:MurR/RpiR family transcriptional regulator, partial [Escherichia coli]|nr:MurR/RpiR family transcriptional regulator [Escherichia coli]